MLRSTLLRGANYEQIQPYFIASGAGAMKTSKNVRVSIDQLPIGFTCDVEVYDDRGQLLLDRGQPLTETAREQIIRRGISSVAIPSERAKSLSSRSRNPKKQDDKDSRGDLRQRRVERSRESYSTERGERFAARSAATISGVMEIGSQLSSLTVNDVAKLQSIPQEFSDMLVEDADQSIFNLSRECDPFSVADRCVQMSTLSINTAIELGIDDRDVMNVGSAALLHDLGLYLMPSKYCDPTVALSAEEAWEYRQHPLITIDALAHFSAVPEEVRVMIGQVHEKPDGSGYPRQLLGARLHPHAEILSVVDAYLMLVRPGPGRPAMVPHDAISVLLHEGSRGRFSAAVLRAFVTQMTLYAIGSDVELSDGTTATVIRRDGQYYASPVVLRHNESTDQPLILFDSDHSVKRPMVDEASNQMRMTVDMISTIDLDFFDRSTCVS